MINEYFFQLSDEERDKLVHKAERNGYNCELDYIADKVKEFIENDDQMEIF